MGWERRTAPFLALHSPDAERQDRQAQAEPVFSRVDARGDQGRSWRLNRSLSWVVQRAWKVARQDVKKLPERERRRTADRSRFPYARAAASRPLARSARSRGGLESGARRGGDDSSGRWARRFPHRDGLRARRAGRSIRPRSCESRGEGEAAHPSAHRARRGGRRRARARERMERAGRGARARILAWAAHAASSRVDLAFRPWLPGEGTRLPCVRRRIRWRARFSLASAEPIAAPSANRYQTDFADARRARREITRRPRRPRPRRRARARRGSRATVVDVRGARSRVLRPGALGIEALRAIEPDIEAAADVVADAESRGFTGHGRATLRAESAARHREDARGRTGGSAHAREGRAGGAGRAGAGERGRGGGGRSRVAR